MGNSASSEQQQQESPQQNVQSNISNINNNNNTNTTSKTNSINIKQSKVSEQSLNKDKTEYTTPSISYSSPLSPPIPGMMQQVVNNSNNSNSNNNNDNNNDNKTNDTSTTATTTIPTITTSTNATTSTPNINTENIVTSSTSTPSTSDTTTTTLPKPVPGRSGWVSSTGSSSPWYGGGSLSSSASSTQPPQPYSSSYQQQNKTSHRQSISGPYYRARGMSINQQQLEPNDDELINQSSSVQPSPSTSQQLPRLQLQQLQINSPSLSSPVSATKSDSLPKEKSTPGIPTIITWSHGGNNVYVTGTFNGWKHKIQLVKSTHDFSTVVDLPIGTHRLKFIVDDEWKCSNEMETATDPDGNLVNYLQVLDEDDVEEDSDLFQRGTNEDGHDYSNNNEDDDSDQYTNIIPEELTLLAEAMQTAATDPHNMDQQKRDAIEWERKQPQPPCLPPHLEKVLLNSQNVSEEDNSVLPTPNHVTLNHLYACSIKDQVMALSTTTRYRKKYVTTMYYRPVQ